MGTRARLISLTRLGIAAGLLTCGMTASAAAGSFTAFGPQVYTRQTGAPIVVCNSFTVLNPSTEYRIHIAVNGVSSAVAFIKGTNKGPVTVTFTASDALSDVDPATLTPPVVSSSDGANLSATGQALDLAGNVGSTTLRGINIDTTPPSITAILSRVANANGWNNTPVTVHFSCSDAGSGIDKCAVDQVVSTDGASQTATGDLNTFLTP